MRVHFLVDESLTPLEGNLIYNASDRAFDFKPTLYKELVQRVGRSGLTSLTIGTLQIEVGVGTSIALYIWGYYPHESWKHEELGHLEAQPGGIRIAVTNEGLSNLEPGISVSLVEINEWPAIFDPNSGWLRIGSGDPDTDSHSTCIRFANDTIAVINEGSLTAVWLHPDIR